MFTFNKNWVVLVLIVFCFSAHLSSADNKMKYRVCVAEGHRGYRKSAKYCPILDKDPNSQVECVLGVDRLDCLRRISKGKVDFSVFTAEDLVIAVNSQVNILVTNEMRFTSAQFEYEVVAVVSNFADIYNTGELRNTKLCHPGYGYERDWTRILANYFEANVVPQSCDQKLTLTENRIKATSEFFSEACKSGPWVNDEILDYQLKNKYSNLCSLCASPGLCSNQDKYWGRRGPLICLTDGVGDVAWARLDDVRAHFALNSKELKPMAPPDQYSFLCRDGSLMSLTSSKPCVWVTKPWPVVAAQSTNAENIQHIISSLSHYDDNSWRSALLNLIETYHVDIYNVNPISPIDTFLSGAPGFLSAYSFSGCHPPRTIRICTTSNIENSKCGWLRETATVYGIEPSIDCVRANSKEHCLEKVHNNLADIVIIHPDMRIKARRFYNLETLFYENTSPKDLYVTLAIIKSESKKTIKSLQDLKGKRACFPSYDSVAWNTIIYLLKEKGLLRNECPYVNAIADFFGDSCVPGLIDGPKSLTKQCEDNLFNDDKGAFRCLASGKGDVAFIEHSTILNYTDKASQEPWAEDLKSEDFFKLCLNNDQCGFSWTPPSEAVVRNNISNTKKNEIYDAFMQIGRLFGKNRDKFYNDNNPFVLFGPFDARRNILFLDKSLRFDAKPDSGRNILSHNYEDIVKNLTICNLSTRITSNTHIFIILTFLYIIL